MTVDQGTDQRAVDGAASPHLTAALPGIGGRIKEQVEDFRVEELPLYEPSGEGQHTFFEIEKTGISTYQAGRDISRVLAIPPNRISHAGLKDAQAITRQVLSVQDIAPETLTAVALPGIRVNWAKRHRSKLKIGHLRGNRFTIRVRGVDESAVAPCQEILDALASRGVPNRYGPQRFGMRGSSAALGQGVLRRDALAFLGLFLGRPGPGESAQVQQARTLVDEGRLEEAMRLYPARMADERRALQILLRTAGDHQRAYASVPKRLKVFFLSAYQSGLFNRIVDVRLQSLDRVFEGDLAMKHPGRSVFRVEDAATEQPRASRFEISPTGPVYGFKMTQPSGLPGVMENEILASEDLTLEDFRVGGGIRARGERRALRFQVNEPEVWFDQGIVLRFWLLRGCYATALLSEIMKPNPHRM